MERLADNVFMVESVEELPKVFCKELFLDVETTSFNPKRGGDNPWGGDRICGLSVTWDDHPEVYYVPVRHDGLFVNIDVDGFRAWLARTLADAPEWINHSVKFDAHLCLADGAEPSKRLIDTLVLAKIHDTDRMQYGLKVLMKDWLDMPPDERDDVERYLKSVKSKNFGDVPPDILGRYAAKDVIANRALYRMLQREKYDGAPWEHEIALTSVLLRIERHGFSIDKLEVKKELARTSKKIIDLASKIAELTGREYSGSSTWIYDLLVNVNGLPILLFNDKTGRPTFNKRALKMYESVCSGELLSVVKAIAELRIEDQYRGLFLEPFLELSKDGRIHPSYNQLVRTGRMSCRNPNIQQQNKRSKKLLHPDPGRCFISCDYSQIEFRLIAHYSRDEDVIRAYNEDPDTDFHDLVTSIIYGIPIEKVTKALRKKGKTINFGMGYGMGKRKLLMTLMSDPDIIAEVTAELDAEGVLEPELRKSEFDQRCEARALDVYSKYHERMPGIHNVSRSASDVCKRRGFVFNPYGRRRHLPVKFARKAFNSIVQGGAMDIIKEAMVRCDQDEYLQERDVYIVANVHDEIVFSAPVERMLDKDLHDHIVRILESPSVAFRVPIRVGLGVSAKSWAEAAGDDTIVDATGTPQAGKLK